MLVLLVLLARETKKLRSNPGYIISETGKILSLVSTLHHYVFTCKILQSKYIKHKVKANTRLNFWYCIPGLTFSWATCYHPEGMHHMHMVRWDVCLCLGFDIGSSVWVSNEILVWKGLQFHANYKNHASSLNNWEPKFKTTPLIHAITPGLENSACFCFRFMNYNQFRQLIRKISTTFIYQSWQKNYGFSEFTHPFSRSNVLVTN